MKEIFVSYKRENKESVIRIVNELRSKSGLDFWVDLTGIESGDWFENTIIKAINNCNIFVFMLSKESIQTPDIGESWTQREVKFALRKGKRIIPVSIDGTTVNDCDWLCFNCSGLNAIDYSIGYQREKLIKDLVKWNDRNEKAYNLQISMSIDEFDEIITKPRGGNKNAPFVFAVEDKFHIRRETIVTGCIEQGIVRVGDTFMLQHQGAEKNVIITGIEKFRNFWDEAEAGENVGLLLKGINKEDVDRGDIIYSDKTFLQTKEVKCDIYLLSKDECSNIFVPYDLYKGDCLQICLRTKDVTGSIKDCTSRLLPGGYLAVQLQLSDWISVKRHDVFAIRKNNTTIGLGVIQ